MAIPVSQGIFPYPDDGAGASTPSAPYNATTNTPDLTTTPPSADITYYVTAPASPNSVSVDFGANGGVLGVTAGDMIQYLTLGTTWIKRDQTPKASETTNDSARNGATVKDVLEDPVPTAYIADAAVTAAKLNADVSDGTTIDQGTAASYWNGSDASLGATLVTNYPFTSGAAGALGSNFSFANGILTYAATGMGKVWNYDASTPFQGHGVDFTMWVLCTPYCALRLHTQEGGDYLFNIIESNILGGTNTLLSITVPAGERPDNIYKDYSSNVTMQFYDTDPRITSGLRVKPGSAPEILGTNITGLPVSTTTSAGLMTAADKIAVDNITGTAIAFAIALG